MLAPLRRPPRLVPLLQGNTVYSKARTVDTRSLESPAPAPSVESPAAAPAEEMDATLAVRSPA